MDLAEMFAQAKAIAQASRAHQAAAVEEDPAEYDEADELYPDLQQEGEGEPDERTLATEPYSFSSTQFELPNELTARVLELTDAFADADLAEPGIEENSHVTILYGLWTTDPAAVKAVVEGFGPVPVTLGKVSLFPAREPESQRGGDQFDVVKIDVEGERLRELNRLLRDHLQHSDSHPVYRPHITLGYLLPGRGQQYAGNEALEGETVTLDMLIFSDPYGNRTRIHLGGERELGWVHRRGPRGGNIWFNTATGAKVYGHQHPSTRPIRSTANTGPAASASAPEGTQDEGKALADLFANLFNLLDRTGKQPEDAEVEAALHDLEESGWTLEWDTDQHWHAVADADVELSLLWETYGFDLASERAPKGGVTISGKFYAGGKFIPSRVIAEASPEDKARLEVAKAEGEQRKGERTAARKARGSVDADKLKGRLGKHGHHELTVFEKRSAASAFRMLHRHHGELALHRVEELTERLEDALAGLPEGDASWDGLRENIGRQLAGLHGMLDMAGKAGVTGKVETPPEPQPPQEEPGGKESEKLPDQVRRNLQISVDSLKDLAESLQRGRQTDGLASGRGRYEAEVFRDYNHGRIEQARRTLAKFREMAVQNGVDADKVLKELGVPDESELQLSPSAQGWWDDKKSAEPDPAKTEPTSPAEQRRRDRLREIPQTLAQIPEGGEGHVQGWRVVRTGANRYRMETDTGFVEGSAGTVAERLHRNLEDQATDQKRIDAAKDRHADKGNATLFSPAYQQEQEAFHGLKEGTGVVMVEGNHVGRTGRIVREGTQNKVKLDGTPGLLPVQHSSVEPLDPKDSWRAEPEEQTGEPSPTQGNLFGGQPKGKTSASTRPDPFRELQGVAKASKGDWSMPAPVAGGFVLDHTPSGLRIEAGEVGDDRFVVKDRDRKVLSRHATAEEAVRAVEGQQPTPEPAPGATGAGQPTQPEATPAAESAPVAAATPEPVAEPTPPEPGFTGTTTDALGREYHWVNGKRVASAEEVAAAKTAGTLEEPQPTETASDATERTEPAAGTGRPGDAGAGVGGDDSGNAGGTAGAPAPKGRIVTARAALTRPGNPDLVPQSVRPHLDEHQVQGAAKAIEAMDAHGGFLLADGTGAGKTRSQLAVAKAYADRGKKVLIVTKNEVIKPDWKKGTVSGSFKNDSATMGVDLKLNKGEDAIGKGEVHVTTYDRLAAIKGQIDKDTVVLFDESHSLKNWGSARAKHGYEMSKAAGAVMYATATPADKPLHIAHLFRARVFGDRPWEDTYREMGMIQKEIRTPNGTIKKWEVNPKVGYAEVYRRMSGLFDRMTEDGLMLKREISFDGVGIGIDHIQLPPEAHEMMAKIEQEVSARAGNPGLAKALVLMHQRRQQEPFKVPHVVDAVQKELAEGRQVVVFASRVNASEIEGADEEVIAGSEGTMKLLLDAMAAAGIKDVVELHGGVTPKQRLKAMEDFQGGKGKVIIATVESGGTGINLDDTVGDKPRTLIMMTAPFSAVENVQAAGRVWRLKTKSNARIRYLFGDSDVDRWNANLIAGKMKTLGAAVGGEVGRLDVAGMGDVSEEGILEAQQQAGKADAAEPYQWPSLKPQPRLKLTGNTFAHKDTIKALGGKWDGDAWTIPGHAVERAKQLRGVVVEGHEPQPEPAKPAAAVTQPQTPDLAPATPAAAEPERHVTDVQRTAIHEAVRILAGLDTDRARERNAAGFNQMDSEFGARLAGLDRLTDGQAAAAAKMLAKYHRQLPETLLKTATTFAEKPAEVKPPPSAEPAKLSTRKVKTSRGERVVHSFRPSEKFWNTRRAGKLPSHTSVSKNPQTGQWEASVWGGTEDEIARNVAELKKLGVY